ncbi:Sporulation sigma factor SigK [Paenibacillus alkaliterrae]
MVGSFLFIRIMHLWSLKKTRKDVSLHDPISTDKEGNEITLIDILGTEADDIASKGCRAYTALGLYENRRSENRQGGSDDVQ